MKTFLNSMRLLRLLKAMQEIQTSSLFETNQKDYPYKIPPKYADFPIKKPDVDNYIGIKRGKSVRFHQNENILKKIFEGLAIEYNVVVLNFHLIEYLADKLNCQGRYSVEIHPKKMNVLRKELKVDNDVNKFFPPVTFIISALIGSLCVYLGWTIASIGFIGLLGLLYFLHSPITIFAHSEFKELFYQEASSSAEYVEIHIKDRLEMMDRAFVAIKYKNTIAFVHGHFGKVHGYEKDLTLSPHFIRTVEELLINLDIPDVVTFKGNDSVSFIKFKRETLHKRLLRNKNIRNDGVKS